MGKGNKILEHLSEDIHLSMGLITERSIVEIAGSTRVLIENHLGVKAYSREEIAIKVSYGCICVRGCNLEIIRMSKEQLVIIGEIHSVGLQRRK